MQRSTPGDVAYTWIIGLLAGLGILILIGPVLVVIATSFTTSQTLKFPPPGLSLRWYGELFNPARSAQIHTAALNSLWVAGLATAIGGVLAVFAALAISRVARPSARVLEASFLSPLVLPTLSYGLAALMFFSVLGIRPSLNLLIAGHLVVIAPFVFRTTLASLSQLDPALLEASANLGASRLYGFRRITLPQLFPGILAGAMLAFVISLDDVVITEFVKSAGQDTLPTYMLGQLRRVVTPEVNAISTAILLAGAILVSLFFWFSRGRE